MYLTILLCTLADCTGGVVQYFNDRECNQYLGSSSLASGQDACSASTSAAGILQTAFQKYQCSTSVSPDVLSSSVTTGSVFYLFLFLLYLISFYPLNLLPSNTLST